MSLETDSVFNELYDEEFGKIPFIFRFSRRRFIIAFSAICALLLATVAFIFAFFGSGNSQEANFPIILIFTGLTLCLAVVWVIIGRLFEDRAFKKASHLAQMIRLSEHRLEMRRWEKIRTDSRF